MGPHFVLSIFPLVFSVLFPVSGTFFVSYFILCLLSPFSLSSFTFYFSLIFYPNFIETYFTFFFHRLSSFSGLLFVASHLARFHFLHFLLSYFIANFLNLFFLSFHTVLPVVYLFFLPSTKFHTFKESPLLFRF